MQNIFTNVPDAVLRFTLFPFLDYNDRAAVNQCLPVTCRIGKRIADDSLIIADILYAIKNLKKPLMLIEKLKRGTASLADAIYNYLSVLIPANLVLVKYNQKFRGVLFERLDYFSSNEAFIDSNCSVEFQKKLYAVCASVRLLIERDNPFIRHIRMPVTDTYSFVGDSLPKVVTGFGKCRYGRKYQARSRYIVF